MRNNSVKQRLKVGDRVQITVGGVKALGVVVAIKSDGGVTVRPWVTKESRDRWLFFWRREILIRHRFLMGWRKAIHRWALIGDTRRADRAVLRTAEAYNRTVEAGDGLRRTEAAELDE